MSTARSRTLLIVPALLALALGTLTLGQAPATARPIAAASVAVDDDDRAYGAPNAGLAACAGGAQEATASRLNDAPTTIGENQNLLPLPGAVIPVVVPNGDSDLIEVTFDAEARLTGQLNSFATPTDFLRVAILVNGVPLAPDNDLMFTTDIGQSNATQACKRLGPGNYNVSVAWQVVDQAGASVLNGTLDDWLLNVRVSG